MLGGVLHYWFQVIFLVLSHLQGHPSEASGPRILELVGVSEGNQASTLFFVQALFHSVVIWSRKVSKLEDTLGSLEWAMAV